MNARRHHPTDVDGLTNWNWLPVNNWKIIHLRLDTSAGETKKDRKNLARNAIGHGNSIGRSGES
ncbi:hypothetical protein RBWH47_02029 [Rhodopirellula baltica WH47]|uniref:Uncharacterized protein n=1 Tax=Rhodopirellula baltica WH47 TaxID=991778 RepID=F2AZU4_RHOBT|nr:hypothetical protein RBWH47_02029 [Rhodopirellula baltica WH47]